jgi:hypothetical protein
MWLASRCTAANFVLAGGEISMRLMEDANIYQIAKNCRTSVGMIEKYYGVHVKNSLNAAAINVVRSGDVMAEEEEVEATSRPCASGF